MEFKKITKELNEHLNCGDLKGFKHMIGEFVREVSEEKTIKFLSGFLFEKYTSLKAGFIAKLMEIIIREKPDLALINFPENHFFRTTVIHGSVDLFDCYIEEFVQPYIEKNKDVDAIEFYTDLISITDKYNELISEQESQVIKGLHFNGAFSRSEEHPHAVLIIESDYKIMDAIVEKYNAAIGRRLIVAKLYEIIKEID